MATGRSSTSKCVWQLRTVAPGGVARAVSHGRTLRRAQEACRDEKPACFDEETAYLDKVATSLDEETADLDKVATDLDNADR